MHGEIVHSRTASGPTGCLNEDKYQYFLQILNLVTYKPQNEPLVALNKKTLGGLIHRCAFVHSKYIYGTHHLLKYAFSLKAKRIEV